MFDNSIINIKTVLMIDGEKFKDLARDTFISKSIISAYMNGKKKMPQEFLDTISERYNLTVKQLRSELIPHIHLNLNDQTCLDIRLVLFPVFLPPFPYDDERFIEATQIHKQLVLDSFGIEKNGKEDAGLEPFKQCITDYLSVITQNIQLKPFAKANWISCILARYFDLDSFVNIPKKPTNNLLELVSDSSTQTPEEKHKILIQVIQKALKKFPSFQKQRDALLEEKLYEKVINNIDELKSQDEFKDIGNYLSNISYCVNYRNHNGGKAENCILGTLLLTSDALYKKNKYAMDFMTCMRELLGVSEQNE